MEYIKKEELIIDEIYTHNNGNIVRYETLTGAGKVCGMHIGGNKNILCYDNGNFTIKELKLATSEEKHWFESCIKLDKFITFEETMKTFIPEYVECTANSTSAFTKNKIYKIENLTNFNYTFDLLDNDNNLRNVIMDGGLWSFKPSTKEAYDAQFVVKEPEFVLPEKWCIKRDSENDKIVTDYINKIASILHSYLPNNVNNPYLHNNTYGCCSHNKIYENYTEITFKQFKKYVLKEETIVKEVKVIEPLPQFKVIETIETITKVENNEGNQFFIGDSVKSLGSNQKGQIIKFIYSADKSNIIAITTFQSNNGIGINKIEHYIESIVEVKEETLLEKAKRLYPVGTKFKSPTSGNLFTIKNHIPEKCDNENAIVFQTIELNKDDYYYACVHSSKNEWAEIIEYPHGFKIGDKIASKYGNTVWKITKIEGNQLIFETSSLPKINSILAKNAIKVN